jgi:hypothetical protein
MKSPPRAFLVMVCCMTAAFFSGSKMSGIVIEKVTPYLFFGIKNTKLQKIEVVDHIRGLMRFSNGVEVRDARLLLVDIAFGVMTCGFCVFLLIVLVCSSIWITRMFNSKLSDEILALSKFYLSLFHPNPITASDKAFFEQIQEAILKDDIEWLSNSVSYPVDVHLNKRNLHLENREDFKKHASDIIDKDLKSVTRNQSANKLFKNWQGIKLKIGHGELWFSQVGERSGLSWVYRITAINLNK